MRHGLRVPAFGEHADGDDVLDLLAGLAGLPHRVHRPAEQLRLLGLGQLALDRRAFVVIALRILLRRLQRRGGFLCGLGLIQHLRVDVQHPFRVAQLVDVDAL